MSQLSELVLAKRAEKDALVQIEQAAARRERDQLDSDIADAGLWRGLDVPRPEYKATRNGMLYRIVIVIDRKWYNLGITVHRSGSTNIGILNESNKYNEVHIADILDAETTIARLAECLQ